MPRCWIVAMRFVDWMCPSVKYSAWATKAALVPELSWFLNHLFDFSYFYKQLETIQSKYETVLAGCTVKCSCCGK